MLLNDLVFGEVWDQPFFIRFCCALKEKGPLKSEGFQSHHYPSTADDPHLTPSWSSKKQRGVRFERFFGLNALPLSLISRLFFQSSMWLRTCNFREKWSAFGPSHSFHAYYDHRPVHAEKLGFSVKLQLSNFSSIFFSLVQEPFL